MTDRLGAIAKHLRRRGTEAEKLLWNHLRAKQLHGLRFRRQEPIGRYIVDFLCYEVRMVIEVDGGQHAGAKVRDNERDEWLTSQGFNVLRFWDNEVLMNVEGVLENIKDQVSPSPSPSRQGRGNQ
jgi:very-short-patch-repair endonuclease